MIEYIQDFFALEGDEDDAEKVMEHNVATDDDDNALARLDAMSSKGASLLSVVQAQIGGGGGGGSISSSNINILKILDDVLLDEMNVSKNLTAWPCESFWTVGEPGDRLTISPIIQRIARAISPQCDAPFTSCFVQRDKCEFNGDGACLK
jgi:hypothetical protein